MVPISRMVESQRHHKRHKVGKSGPGPVPIVETVRPLVLHDLPACAILGAASESGCLIGDRAPNATENP